MTEKRNALEKLDRKALAVAIEQATVQLRRAYEIIDDSEYEIETDEERKLFDQAMLELRKTFHDRIVDMTQAANDMEGYIW